MSSDIAVSVQDLTKVFRTPMRRQKVLAVDKVTFQVKAGEVYGLIGPNGSGKSTTMKVMLGLLQPTIGKTEIFGRESRHVDSRHEVGFLPENPYFYKYLTGKETLHFYGKLCGLKGKELEERTKEMLKLVNLEHAQDRRLGGYSKGMLQRIGLAQAIIHWPRLVILDEPTAGVDPSGSRTIRDLIIQLKERGITVILTSHLLEQVQEVCDRIGIMYHGKMVREGPLQELIAIENQTEILLEHCDDDLLQKIKNLVQDYKDTKLIRTGKPRTTLERIFLEATEDKPAEKPEYLNSSKTK